MLKNKKILVATTIASSLLVPLITTQSVHAAWHANTPTMITNLNNNGTYTVKAGDTLWAIGMHYNIKPSVIAQTNNISNPNNLQIGTIIQLSQVNKNHAILTIKNGNNINQKYLNNNDKINTKQSFNKKVTSTPTNNSVVSTINNNINQITNIKPTQTSSQMTQYIKNELQKVDGNTVTNYTIKKVDNNRYFVYDASSKSNEPIWVVDAHTGAMLKA